MKIVIVGAGAMGCLFAALLRRSGQDVVLVEKKADTVAAVERRGIILESSAGTQHVDVPIARDGGVFGQADCVVLCVKAFDTEGAARTAAACIGARTAVVTLQNGIGNAEVLTACFPLQEVLAGITAHGATLLGPGHVRHAGLGETAIAPLHPAAAGRAQELLTVFENAGIATRLGVDAQALLWSKLLVNIGINPLGAVLNASNGSILDSEHTRRIMHAAVREGVEVAAAKGICFDADDQIVRVEIVCRATRDNLCSMLQDIRAGRRTEIEYMNGAVVREAYAKGVSVPVNSMLAALVAARQQLAAASAGAC
jgi:2-dehydropantoate 2-reductase